MTFILSSQYLTKVLTWNVRRQKDFWGPQSTKHKNRGWTLCWSSMNAQPHINCRKESQHTADIAQVCTSNDISLRTPGLGNAHHLKQRIGYKLRLGVGNCFPQIKNIASITGSATLVLYWRKKNMPKKSTLISLLNRSATSKLGSFRLHRLNDYDFLFSNVVQIWPCATPRLATPLGLEHSSGSLAWSCRLLQVKPKALRRGGELMTSWTGMKWGAAMIRIVRLSNCLRSDRTKDPWPAGPPPRSLGRATF